MRELDWRESVKRSEPRQIDCGLVEFVDHHSRQAKRYFLNIASFGSSGLVTQKVNQASKWLGGKGTYLLGTVQGMMEYKNQRVKIEFDGRRVCSERQHRGRSQWAVFWWLDENCARGSSG